MSDIQRLKYHEKLLLGHILLGALITKISAVNVVVFTKKGARLAATDQGHTPSVLCHGCENTCVRRLH